MLRPLLAVASFSISPLLAQTAGTAPGRTCQPVRAVLAVEEVMAINLFVNRADAWVFNQPWAETDFESWSSNIRLGWEWDENAFPTNMFGHPFHGSMYFNAGRSNCLTYWESVPLAFLGSWVWEYFGETYRPSFNDFFMTSFGGIALGEVTHRVAATLRNTEVRGGGRWAGEVGTLLINPIEGLNRLFRGDWTRVAPNPPEHDPGAYTFRLAAGGRRVHEDSTGITNLAPTIMLDMNYGDLFDRPFGEPFDVFSVRVQVSPGGGGLNLLQGRGRIYQTRVPWWGTQVRHEVEVSQMYDYIHNPVYSFGAQSIELGLISRFPLPRAFRLRTKFTTNAIVLGALDAPYGGVGERTYDFGPGFGGTFELSIERHGWTYLTFYNRAEYLHSVSGAPANHLIAFSGLEGNVFLKHGIGVGFQLSGDTRRSEYSDMPTNTRQFFETRIFVSWATFRAAPPRVDAR